MNYWLHRISHHQELSYPLLEKGYLTIGFSDLIGTNVIEYVDKQDWNSFDNAFIKKWGTVPRDRYYLINFLNMRKDDIVIVPTWGSFHVLKITGELPIEIGAIETEGLRTWANEDVYSDGKYLNTNRSEKIDLGFAHKIEFLKRDVSRDKFADAKLTARMKMRHPNGMINDIKDSIEESIQNCITDNPINLHFIIQNEVSNNVLDIIKSKLNPDKFEILVKKYFETIGADNVYIPAKNESGKQGDADIVAVFEKLRLIIYAQAKFQSGEIDDWGINQIIDYKNDKELKVDGYNQIAWVVTTADKFNENAVKTATKNSLQLVNGIEFSKMLLDAGLSSLSDFSK